VSADDPLLDREALAEAFRRLGDRLARRGLTADVYVFGGAAMALAYDARRATRDIDAVFQPHGVVVEEAWAVADELGWPRWWLNEQASVYVAPGGGSHGGTFGPGPRHGVALVGSAASKGASRTRSSDASWSR